MYASFSAMFSKSASVSVSNVVEVVLELDSLEEIDILEDTDSLEDTLETLEVSHESSIESLLFDSRELRISAIIVSLVFGFLYCNSISFFK